MTETTAPELEFIGAEDDENVITIRWRVAGIPHSLALACFPNGKIIRVGGGLSDFVTHVTEIDKIVRDANDKPNYMR